MARLVLNPTKVRLAAKAPAEALVRRTAYQIQQEAKRIAGQGKYATGDLSSRIEIEYRDTVWTFRARIGPKPRQRGDEPAHQGAKPHPIRPRRRRGLLVFYWRKVGQTVYLRRVKHPGMRGKQYLVKPLRQFGRRNGFRVVFVPKVR